VIGELVQWLFWANVLALVLVDVVLVKLVKTGTANQPRQATFIPTIESLVSIGPSDSNHATESVTDSRLRILRFIRISLAVAFLAAFLVPAASMRLTFLTELLMLRLNAYG
jgi:hypothetical protein